MSTLEDAMVSSLLRDVAKIRAFEMLLLEEFKVGNILGTIHTAIGQEYVPTILARLTKESLWFSNHRGHAHFLSKTGDYLGLFAEILGNEGAIGKGIGGSQHLYSPGSFISNGIQGGQLGIAVGISSDLADANYSAVFFMGDGTTGAGHIYEALNLSKLYKSRLLVILEDNEIAQSTPTRSTTGGDLKQRFLGLGLEYFSWSPGKIDVSSDLKNLIVLLEKCVNNMNQGIPTLVNIKTNRLAPHSKGDDNRSKEYVESLQKQDFLNLAIASGLFSDWSETYQEVTVILNEVKKRNSITSRVEEFLNPLTSRKLEKVHENPESNVNLRNSINYALKHYVCNHGALLIGQDIVDFPYEDGSQYGGAFKVTSGLSQEFPDSVRNFPISESGMIGFGIGTALSGRKTIVEIMFSDFLSQCLDQIIHQVSKLQSVYGNQIELPLLVRTASGPGRGYGPTHSHTLESQLVGLPNLMVASANPFVSYLDILNSWIDSQRCFIVFEPKELYAYSPKDFQSRYYTVHHASNIYDPIVIRANQAEIDLTIVVYGSALWEIINELDSLLYESEVSIEVLIPTVLSAWNANFLLESLKRSGGKLLLITDNLNSNGFLDRFIVDAFRKGAISRLESMHFSDWIPSGKLESKILINKNRFRNLVMRCVQN